MLRVTAREVFMLCGAAVAGAVACASYGVWLFMHGQFVAQNGIGNSRLSISLGHGAFINEDHFSAALVFPIALSLVAALSLRGWRKVAAALVFIVLLAGVFASATRGSLVAIGAVCVYLMIRYRHRLQLAGIAAMGLVASLPFPSMWLRFTDPSQSQAGGRFSIWALAWEAFRHHWLYGIGPGLFYLAYGEAYPKMFITGMQPYSQDAHNLIVSTSVEVGVIGLALMLAGWFLQFRLLEPVQQSSSLYDLRVGLQAALLGLFVVAMSVDIFFYKYLWIVFILTVLARNAWITEEERLRAADPLYGEPSRPTLTARVVSPEHAVNRFASAERT